MRAKILIVLAALISLTALWGCGSSMDSSGDGTGGDDLRDQIAAAGFVGADRCIDCHQGFSWSAEAVQKYLESKHVIHSTSINAKSDEACLKCHDPIGDGPFVEPFINSNDVPDEGLAAVTCEACHGTGIDHYGIGPMPYPNPDYEVCGGCHNDIPDNHIRFHPLADNILDNFKRGAHYLIDPDTGENDARDGAPCFRCHSDEGYRDYIGITVGLDGDQLDEKLNGIADLPTATTIQCRTCHVSHSGDLRANETTERIRVNETILEPRPVSFSREFNLCTSCHQVFLDATAVISTDPGADPGEEESFEYFNYILDAARRPFHASTSGPTDSGSRVIWDTHFLLPDETDPDLPLIVGYNINAADEKACTQCHDPHAGSKFEQSFAGGIAEAWGNTELFHGDYQNFPTRDFQSCARCHSGTEHIKWINGLEDWDLSSGEARVIACVTCHDLTAVNDSGDGFELGALRDYVREQIFFPPFPTEENADTFMPTDPVRLGLDTSTIGSDNFCIGCHLGRGGKGELDEEIAEITGTDESISRNDNHHGYAAATRYGNMAKGGYEYDQRANADGQYSYSSKFEHVTAYDDCNECHSIHTGKVKIGDCSDCHLASDNMPVENETDLWDIRMPGSSADYDGDGNTTEGVYYEIQGLWLTLQDKLNKLLGTPTDDDDAGSFNIPGTSTNYERLAKAQYNLNYADMFGENFRDNGAYAHNPAYVIELLYDSLDDLDDGLQNDSVADAENNLGIARDDAGHFDAAAEAFRHWDLIYNENDQEFEEGSIPSRCNKCHSSEGSAYFLENDMVKGTYDRQDTKGISAGLACEACHFPSAVVGLPVGEAIVPVEVTFPSGAVQNLNNTSNICMTCHQGRESGQSIDDVIENNPDGPYSFINIHYFPAAATFFGSGVNGGYEYAGKNYVGQWSHTSTRADCEGCHVDQASQHDFILVTPTTSCGCHGNPLNDFKIIRVPSPGIDYDGDGDATEGIYGEIWGMTDQESTHPADENSIVGNLFIAIENYALNVIGEAIQYDPSSYPYYFKEGSISFGNRYDQFDASLLKAAYNYQMIQKDSCGYIHNAEYHLQLLIDSIEDLGGDISKYTRP